MNRFCIFPIVDMDVWQLYKKQVHSLWFPDEIDFSDDYRGYITLDDDHKHSLKMILAFFANFFSFFSIASSSLTKKLNIHMYFRCLWSKYITKHIP